MEYFELPDGRKVRITDRTAENIDNHDDCPFCEGRTAAHRGEPDRNPYVCTADPGSDDWYQSDHALWGYGYSLGRHEPGGLLWHEQRNFGIEPRG
ncbi:hypothetical protein [Mycobacterium kyorinense]|uniref:hypothetical protein n=1 Tax=Mycobacterium kyorinense TaxID=487514 RepID=UPI001F355795|nr:hypothetical protein [Mycobacterium kyorinense]